jgi:hypothetical protein
MIKDWKPKYPVTELPHDLWKKFPEWLIDENHPNALRHCVEALDKVNDWHSNVLRNLVSLYDWMEKERKESRGEVSVQACYVFQQGLIELLLGCKVKTVKRFLADMGLNEKKTEKKGESIA